MFLGESLSGREKVARVSGPGEGYSKHFVISVEVSPSLHPSPDAHLTMGVTLSLRERDLRKT
jgi:hypothetical protein